MTELPQRNAGIRISKRLPVLEWAAVVLGVLTFIWGFLDWYGASGVGQNGYRLLDGYLPVGFALLAGLFALVNLRPDRTERTAWLAIGTSLCAVAFTVVAVAVKPTLILLLEGFSGLDGTDPVRLSIRVGLILTLVSTVLQLLCLLVAWVFASGRLVVSGRSGPAAPPSFGPTPYDEPQSFGPHRRRTPRRPLRRRSARRRPGRNPSDHLGLPTTLSGDLTTHRRAQEPLESLRRPSLQRIAPTNRAEGVLSRQPCG